MESIQQPNEALAAAAAQAGITSSGEMVDDGTVLYIDPNDPQAAEILQQAGLRLADDGTVISIAGDEMQVATAAAAAPPMHPHDEMMAQQDHNTPLPVDDKQQIALPTEPVPEAKLVSVNTVRSKLVLADFDQNDQELF